MKKTFQYKLNFDQLKRASDISMTIGHVVLASVVVPAFIDKLNVPMLLFGITSAIGFWIVSVILLRRPL